MRTRSVAVRLPVFFCKAKGHRQYECPEINRKQGEDAHTGVHPGKAQQAITTMKEDEDVPVKEAIATVKETGSIIDSNDARFTHLRN